MAAMGLSKVQRNLLGIPLEGPPDPVINLEDTSLIPDLWLSDSIRNRLQISTGARILPPDLADRMGYSHAAVLPGNTWRPLRSEELNCLFGLRGMPCPWSRGVLLGTTCSVLADTIQSISRLGLVTQALANEFMKTGGYNKFSDLLGDFLKEISFISAPKPQILNICVRPKDWPTTTIDPLQKRRIGLHLDSWDSQTLRSRELCRNRISINLGREDRFLLFCNLTISTFLALTSSRSRAAIASTADLIGSVFTVLPDYPVLKLRIAPGEFYVAPTENMIHDATSLGKRESDVSIAALGYFDCSTRATLSSR